MGVYNRVEEYTVAGSHQGNHSFPAGRTLIDITWDGANWWATTSTGEIIRMDSSFNETLSIPGPNAAAYGTSSPSGTLGGCQFLDGYLYVMTSQGLYRRAV